MKGKYKVVVVISIILLSFLYWMIFSFSEQDGETSGSLSYLITQKCVETINYLAGGRWKQDLIDGLVNYFENPVRKAAHFTEYAIMGVLTFNILYCINKFKLKNVFMICIIWVFVSASFDEIHQMFVPGRCGNFWDVLLDTAGGITGMLITRLFYKLFKVNMGE